MKKHCKVLVTQSSYSFSLRVGVENSSDHGEVDVREEIVAFLVPVGVDEGEDAGFEGVEILVGEVEADGAEFIVAEISD